MKQINILAIGNSFSEDTTHYLHQIALADGIKTKVVNLYIGGCSLETHWKNIEENAANYSYQINGMYTDRLITIKEALLEENWDYVITQQASYNSGIEETYFPYIENIYHYIKKLAPKAVIMLNQTWAYEIDSNHEGFRYYNGSQLEMYDKLKKAYDKAANTIQVDIIPCGDAIQALRQLEPFQYEHGGMSLCRDGYHLNYVYGRYLVAAIWYEVLLKKSILDNSYIPVTHYAPDYKVDFDLLMLVKKCANQIVSKSNAL